MTPLRLDGTAAVIDGALQISTRRGCGSASSEAVSVVVGSTRLRDWSGGFTWTASVLALERAGLVFRAQDQLNLYRFVLDPVTNVHSVERIIAGKLTLLTDAEWRVAPGSYVKISVTMTGTGVISVSLNDADPFITLADSKLRSG